ncbi:MAG: phosphoenolpyruvate-utilizing N-terminal domain-containing protein, partial [Dongiaceae bacterium]
MKPRPAAEQTYRGEPASPGLAIGALVRLAARTQAVDDAGEPPAAAKARLKSAIGRAKDEVAALIAANDAMGADILEFQQELLDDPTLVDAAFSVIDLGMGAASAWAAAIGEQVAIYQSAEDVYFRARAADLTDLRERVIGALSGAGSAAPPDVPDGAIVLAEDMTPSVFLSFDWRQLGGAALVAGSRASHVAMLARARGVPLLTGLEAEPAALAGDAVLDAHDGVLVLSPTAATRARYAGRIAEAADLH